MADAPNILLDSDSENEWNFEEIKFPMDDNTLWDIYQFIDAQIENFTDNTRNFPEGYEKILEQTYSCPEEEVQQVYKIIKENKPHSRGTYTFRNIVKLIIAAQELKKDLISEKMYPVIIECTQILNECKLFRINGFADMVISKLLTLGERKDEIPFEDLAKGYYLAYQMSRIIRKRYTIKLELSFLIAPIKVKLYELVLNADVEKIRAAINCIVIAENYHCDLSIFKDSLKITIKQWKDYLGFPVDFDTSLLDAKPEVKPFYEFEPDQPDPVEEQIDDPSANYKEGVKNKVLYMTNQDVVNVSVWQATLPTGEIVALKECVSHTKEALTGYFEEIKCLQLLSGKSKNFLKFYGANIEQLMEGEVEKCVLKIQMEYVESTLKSDKYSRSIKKNPYNDLEILSIYKQLILAFNQMRQLSILHCDIKPSNIMISKDFVIKIIDFNTAKMGINEATMQIGAIGTKDFMSPEIRQGFNTANQAIMKEDKGDVYSLGMTILYLVTDESLVDMNLVENKEKLSTIIKNIKYPWLIPILEEMLTFDYTQRPGLKDLIRHFPEDTTVTKDI